MDAESRATAQTLFKNGRPVRQIHLAKVDEFNMGALMMHFMLETILMGKLMGVDPFDQPGVEEGKVLAPRNISARAARMSRSAGFIAKARSTASPPAKWSSVPPPR